MSSRHELFEELEAFDPEWVSNFSSLKDAVKSACISTPYMQAIYLDYLSTPTGVKYQDNVANVFDYATAVADAQEAELQSQEFLRAMHNMAPIADSVDDE